MRPPKQKVGIAFQELLFWAVACLILLLCLGGRGLWASEGRWAEVTREMFLNGDFFHPTINAQPYFDKPLLTYWLVAAASFFTGSLNELACRLPSALFALLSLWATKRIGKEQWSREIGYTAGWLLLLTYGVVFWGRTAAAETENLAAIILATLWFVKRKDNLTFWTYLGFYLICFIGAQTKGLTSVVVPALVAFPFLVREKRWKTLLSLGHFLAFFIAALVYICPFAYADLTRSGYGESGLALMFRENIVRFIRPFDHKGPIYLYFYYLPLLLMPITPLVLTGIVWMLRYYKSLERDSKWLIEATVLIFVFFTASGSRRGYYILPILPFCTLVGAVFVHRQHNERWKKVAYALQYVVLGVVVGVFLFSPVIWSLLKGRIGFTPPPGLRLATPILGVAAISIWVFVGWRRISKTFLTMLPRQLAPLLLCCAVLMGGFFGWQQSTLETYRTGRRFAYTLKKAAEGIPASRIAFYHRVSPNLLYYMETVNPVKVLKSGQEVTEFVTNTSGLRILISRRKYLDHFVPMVQGSLKEAQMLEEKIFPWMRRKGRFYVAWKLP